MPIKLLPKQEITRLDAQQKRASMEEGIKLARRVDNLREIAADEEASLASFRVSTVKLIREEIQKAQNERNTVLQEVKSLREELAEGSKRLDERQTKLEVYEKHLTDRERDMEQRIAGLVTLTEQVNKQGKANTTLSRKMNTTWNVLVEYGKQVVDVYTEAKTFLQIATTRADAMVATSNEVEADLKSRDIAVASRERDVMIKEERIERTFKEQRVRELQLRDRELTLEREFNRLKKP